MALGARDRARAFDALSQRASDSLRVFLRAFAWPVVEPSTPYMHGWHVDAIAAHLEAVSAGDIRKLIVNIPPRTMKSTTVSVAWPTWEWLRPYEKGARMGPQTRWLFASYAALLSTRDSLKCRRIIESAAYQRALSSLYDGEQPWQLAGDANLKTKFENTVTGFRLATSVGAAATGEGGDRIVVDDPLNAMEAASDTVLNSTDEWWSGAMSSRLNDPERGAMVIVMQRLHERDTVGLELERSGDEWTHLCLPMEYEPAHPYAWRAPRLDERVKPRLPVELQDGDPRHGTDTTLLIPNRMSQPAVDSLKRRLGSYRASGQLQQLPAPAEGGILKRAWWRYYVTQDWANVHGRPDNAVIAPERSEMDYWLQSWDMAFKDEAASSGEPDYVVGQTWATKGAFKYLIDQVRNHLDFPDTRRAVEAFAAKYPVAYLKLVEDKANGPAIIAELRGKLPGLLPVQVEGNKEARAHAVSWMIEAGDVYLPHPLMVSWVDAFVNECAAFPNAAHDDQVDAMTQALRRLGMGGIAAAAVNPFD